VFDAALPIGDRLYLTLVHTTVPDGDVQFPEFSEHDWKLVDERHVPADEKNAHAMSFRMYERMRT
jgi:dihydrofolate reductase